MTSVASARGTRGAHVFDKTNPSFVPGISRESRSSREFRWARATKRKVMSLKKWDPFWRDNSKSWPAKDLASAIENTRRQNPKNLERQRVLFDRAVLVGDKTDRAAGPMDWLSSSGPLSPSDVSPQIPQMAADAHCRSIGDHRRYLRQQTNWREKWIFGTWPIRREFDHFCSRRCANPPGFPGVPRKEV